jgi:FkbM family methyltransferase
MRKFKRVLIDLGAYNGDTIEVAEKYLGSFDVVYAFEPLSGPYAEMKQRFPGESYYLYRAAGDVVDGESRVYIGHHHGDISSSLHSDNPNCDTESYETIGTVDFPRFLVETFQKNSTDCHVVLKMNIEGSEYRILEKMLIDGSVNLINELFCDWHWYFVGITESAHHDLVRRLRKQGFDVCGDKPDELYHASRTPAWQVRWQKLVTYHFRSGKLALKKRVPVLFRLLKGTRRLLKSRSKAAAHS